MDFDDSLSSPRHRLFLTKLLKLWLICLTRSMAHSASYNLILTIIYVCKNAYHLKTRGTNAKEKMIRIEWKQNPYVLYIMNVRWGESSDLGCVDPYGETNCPRMWWFFFTASSMLSFSFISLFSYSPDEDFMYVSQNLTIISFFFLWKRIGSVAATNVLSVFDIEMEENFGA